MPFQISAYFKGPTNAKKRGTNKKSSRKSALKSVTQKKAHKSIRKWGVNKKSSRKGALNVPFQKIALFRGQKKC